MLAVTVREPLNKVFKLILNSKKVHFGRIYKTYLLIQNKMRFHLDKTVSFIREAMEIIIVQ